MNIGLGLWDSYNMATGLLGDILSYVRLFALGLSGGQQKNICRPVPQRRLKLS